MKIHEIIRLSRSKPLFAVQNIDNQRIQPHLEPLKLRADRISNIFNFNFESKSKDIMYFLDADKKYILRTNESFLDITDLNKFMNIIKKREESFIQIVHFYNKYILTNASEINQSGLLYDYMNELEKQRIIKEDEIIKKYINFIIIKPDDKKLLMKLANKIIELNSSVKDKLIELNVYEKVKDNHKIYSQFEQSLKNFCLTNFISFEVILELIVKNFRSKFQKQIGLLNRPNKESLTYNPYTISNKEDIIRRSYDNTERDDITKGDNIEKYSKSIEREIMMKKGLNVDTERGIMNNVEKIENYYKDERNRVIFHGISHNHGLIKSLSPTNMITNEENSKISQKTDKSDQINKLSLINNENKGFKSVLISSQRRTYNENKLNIGNLQINSTKTNHTQSLSTQNTIRISTDVSNPPLYNDKEYDTLKTENTDLYIQTPLIEDQTVYFKSQLKIPYLRSQGSGGGSCVGGTLAPTSNITKINIIGSPNNQISMNLQGNYWKAYTILNIEIKPIVIPTKPEYKKSLLEKVYHELNSNNTNIKRTIAKYAQDYTSFKERNRNQLNIRRLNIIKNGEKSKSINGYHIKAAKQSKAEVEEGQEEIEKVEIIKSSSIPTSPVMRYFANYESLTKSIKLMDKGSERVLLPDVQKLNQRHQPLTKLGLTEESTTNTSITTPSRGIFLDQINDFKVFNGMNALYTARPSYIKPQMNNGKKNGMKLTLPPPLHHQQQQQQQQQQQVLVLRQQQNSSSSIRTTTNFIEINATDELFEKIKSNITIKDQSRMTPKHYENSAPVSKDNISVENELRNMRFSDLSSKIKRKIFKTTSTNTDNGRNGDMIVSLPMIDRHMLVPGMMMKFPI